MAVETLILIANPGSASRKYGLFDDQGCRAHLHFEYDKGQVICTLESSGQSQRVDVELSSVGEGVHQIVSILKAHQILGESEMITQVGLRVVAPSGYFLTDRELAEDAIGRLKALMSVAPLHIGATLSELESLKQQFPELSVWGISDSQFFANKPDHAWNYGLPLDDADRLEIKRFGYHGLSVASVVDQLKASNLLPSKLVVCHLGGGASVAAVQGGRGMDSSMGFSPLEGIIMATRSGSLDVTAALALKRALKLDDDALEDYLNHQSGLQGLSGIASDVRDLLEQEPHNQRAHLTLNTYTYAVQKMIGQMAAALNGLDALVFTGTVGQRSWQMRERIMGQLGFLGLTIQPEINQQVDPSKLTRISNETGKPVFVVPANEEQQMAHHLGL